MAQPENNKVKLFFPNLDALRFFCFLLVFICHDLCSENKEVLANPFYNFLKKGLFANANLGVNLFFTLSGFLITYLLLVEKENKKTIDVKNFYIRRILRIWPLYFFNVIFGFLLFPILKNMFGEVSTETANIYNYLTFTSNFDMLKIGDADSSMLNVLWSVSIEEQFYLIWPVILLVTNKKYYLHVLLAIIFISNSFRVLNVDIARIEVHTLSSITDMAVGGVFAYLMYQRKRLYDYIVTLKKPYILLIYVLLIGTIISYSIINLYQFNFMKRILLSILFALVISEQNFSSNSIFKLEKLKLISKWGQYTYGLYCLHMIGILIALKVVSKFGLDDSVWKILFIQTPIAFLVSIVIAYLSFRFFEKPFLKLKEKFAFITKGQ